MSLLWRREEQRAITWQDVWGSGGEAPTPGSGTLPALFAAHRAIVDTVASTPLHAYREVSGGTSERLGRAPRLIRPLVGTRYTWKSQIVSSMVSDGNAFGLVTGWDRDSYPTGVAWIDPVRVWVDEDLAPLPDYYVDGRLVDRDRLIHIPWVVPPGKWRGISPLKAFKIAFETGTLAQSWARDWFKNDGVPPVHVKNTARVLSDEQATKVKEKYAAAVRGRRPFVSGSDWDLSVIGVPPDEQRFIESLKLTAGQVATIYGLEPEDVGGEAANSLTYSTVEGNERKRANRIGRPWCMRIEEALSLHVPRPQYFKFNLDANVRADLKTRMEAHEIALRIGLETQDEARVLEERPPLTAEQQSEWLAMYSTKNQQPPASGPGK